MSTQSSLVDRRTWFGPWSRVHQRCHRPQVLCAHFVFHNSQNCTISQWSSTISTACPNWKLTQNRKQITQSTLRFSFYRCLVHFIIPYFVALFHSFFIRNVGSFCIHLMFSWAVALHAFIPFTFYWFQSTGQRKQKEPFIRSHSFEKNKVSFMPSLDHWEASLIFIWKIWFHYFISFHFIHSFLTGPNSFHLPFVIHSFISFTSSSLWFHFIHLGVWHFISFQIHFPSRIHSKDSRLTWGHCFARRCPPFIHSFRSRAVIHGIHSAFTFHFQFAYFRVAFMALHDIQTCFITCRFSRFVWHYFCDVFIHDFIFVAGAGTSATSFMLHFIRIHFRGFICVFLRIASSGLPQLVTRCKFRGIHSFCDCWFIDGRISRNIDFD